jgi:hypothetical protein
VFGIVFSGSGVEGCPDAGHPPWLPRTVGIARSISVLFEQVYGAFSLKPCRDVDGRPAEERGA